MRPFVYIPLIALGLGAFLETAQAQTEDLPKVPASESWRAQRPSGAEPRAPVLPSFEQAKLDNGLTIFLSRIDTLPLVNFNLVFRGGATFDPKGQAGLTSLAFDMLGEGAGDLEALAFSDRVADLGANFGSGASSNQANVFIGGLARNADAMMGLMTLAVTKPRLAAADFERLKQKTIANLIRSRSSPQGLAFERLPAMLYGPDHPYGHPSGGTVESVEKMTLDAVKTQYGRTVGPANAALIVTGTLTMDEAKALAQKHLGAWTHAAEKPPEISKVDPTPRKKIVLVNKPGAQTLVLLARTLFAKGHPDEIPLTLANQVFGGSFASRLNMNLREDKGITYGAGSRNRHNVGVGSFFAYSAIRKDATAQGLEEMFKELAGLKTQPITTDELEVARSGVIRSLPGRFETISSIGGAASALFTMDLPLDYYRQLGRRYAEAQAAAVQKTAETYLVPNLLHILMVGDAAAVQKPVEALKLGPVEVVEP